MKAMIFAAGMGTRLRPLTDQMPKALVPVAGIPLLQRVLLRLASAGFDDITINIHHLGQQIADFLRANRNFGLRIHISDERGQLLNTGGGIRHARPFLEGDEPFLVHNVDILTDADLRALWQHHLARKAEATLLVGKRETKRYLLMDPDMTLHGWTNKQTSTSTSARTPSSKGSPSGPPTGLTRARPRPWRAPTPGTGSSPRQAGTSEAGGNTLAYVK